jgi:hypothetical protein
MLRIKFPNNILFAAPYTVAAFFYNDSAAAAASCPLNFCLGIISLKMKF